MYIFKPVLLRDGKRDRHMNSWSASYDRTTKVVTAMVCLLLIGVAAVTRSWIVASLDAILLFLGYAFSAQGYETLPDSLEIRRLVGRVRVPLDDLLEVRAAGRDDLRGAIRLWGSGGLFGYYGLFRTSQLGVCKWYATDRGKLVVVRTARQTVLVSPDDVAGFVSALGALAPATPGLVPTTPVVGSVVRSQVRTALVAIGFALALVGGLLLYSPGIPAVTVTRDTLAIADHFYPFTLRRANVDLDHVQVVDLRTDKAWKPTLRTNGFANSRYRSGWFRVSGGKTVRLYQASSPRLVLLPPRTGTYVLLEVKDPEAFVADLRRQWGANP